MVDKSATFVHTFDWANGETTMRYDESQQNVAARVTCGWLRLPLLATIAALLGNVGSPGTANAAGGLQGNYYTAKSDRDTVQALTAAKPVRECVGAVDFDWGKNVQARPAQNFLAQWHGCVESSADGEHVFRVEASSATRVVLDGRIIVDVWSRTVPTTADSPPLRLQKGKQYAVLVEQMNAAPSERRKESYIRLLWKIPGAAEFAVVPAAALSPEWPQPPGDAAQVAAPTFQPPAGTLLRPTQVYLAMATPDALIRYTTDNSVPTLLHGDIAMPGGIAIFAGGDYQGSVTITARAFKPGLTDSPAVTAAYQPGKGDFKKGLVTFHTGNSLTDTVVNGVLQTLTRSTGIDHTVLKATIPGAPTDALWHVFTKDVSKPPLMWLQDKSPVDCLITQPFAGHGRSIENETEHSGKFFEACRKHSPHATLWIYQQWSTRDLKDGWAEGIIGLARDPQRWTALPLGAGEKVGDGGWRGTCLFRRPAASYDEAVANHRRYFEILRDELRKKYPEQIVPIIPGGQAMAALKHQIEAGKIPGMRDFFNEVYADGIHLAPPGRYLIGLVFMSSLYQQSFEGRVTEAGSALTPEQARIFQQIAWETVSKDPLSGVTLLRK